MMMNLSSNVIFALVGKTLVTAESCTGGGIGAALTAVPGSSKVYKGGIISYTDAVKRDMLGVPEQVLLRCGAVSADTARYMAVGARQRLQADVAVAVTGLATPRCGDRLRGDTLEPSAAFHTMPVLAARVEPPAGVAPAQLLEKLRILEDEEPMLGVQWDAAHGHVTVQVMGTVQTEVLTQLLQDRFNMKVTFLPPLVLY